MSTLSKWKGRRLTWLPCVVLCGSFFGLHLAAQDPTAQTAINNIESLGTIPVAQPLNGLGFNIDMNQEWEFVLAASAGTTHVRFQCSWVETEIQTAPPQNSSGGYTLSPNCTTGLALSKKYGMHPTIVAAFGAPFHQILTVSVPNGAAAGATTLNVQFSAAIGGDTLASMAPFYDTIIASNGNQLSGRNSYAGDLVTKVNLTDATHATLTLASAMTSGLPANASSTYTINEYLMPPAATSSPFDPSVLAFGNYAKFLAQCIAAAGLTGEVELWNEPPWSPDPWDTRQNFYDNFPGPGIPGPVAGSLPNWGIAAALSQPSYSVSGVHYVWSGTNKSGDNSVLALGMLANTGTLFLQPATNVQTESLHPYGNNPEDDIWSEVCLKNSILPNPLNPQYFTRCNIDSNSTSNAVEVEQLNLIAKTLNPNGGIGHSITETGMSLLAGDMVHQARFTMRQFLSYQAIGVTPVEFYRLYDNSPDNLTFTNLSTDAPLPAFTALSGLMSDLAGIKGSAVVPITVANTPSIVSYGGFYPLDTVTMVGSRSGDTANSEVFAVWQRSHVTGSAKWATSSQPTPVPVTIAIPTGSTAISVVNLDTRAAVSFTVNSQQITFSVSDDPVEVLVEPGAAAAPTVKSVSISPGPESVVVGAVTNFTCMATMSDGTTAACISPVYSSSNASVATVSGNAVTAVATGSSTIAVSVSGSTVTASSVLTVTSASATVVSISISPGSESVVAGTVISFSCTATLSDATTAPCKSPVFSSSNSSVAAVSGSSVTAVAAGSASISVAVSGVAAPAPTVLTVTSAAVTIASISLSPGPESVVAGTVVSFTCTATLSDGSTAPCTAPVYTSSNLTVATVSNNIVTTLASGTTTITATAAGVTASASAILTVTASTATVTSISISPGTESVVTGAVLVFSCTASMSDGTTTPCISPVYSSSNPSVASVSNNSVTALLAGSATISASASGVTTSTQTVLTVTVTTATVASIVIAPLTASIVQGAALNFSCTATLSNETTVPCASPVYTSSTLTVVSMSGNVATGVSPGSATVTVTVAGVATASSAVVTVTAPVTTVTSILIAPQTATIVQGATLSFNCMATLSNGTTAACTAPTYTSSTASVASVADNVATGVSPGTATITAAVAGVATTSSAVVTVTAASVPSATLTASPATGATYGSPVILTETVTAAGGACPASGVAFADGGSLVGIASFIGSPVSATTSCIATITTTALPVGVDTIEATAPADSHFSAITSTTSLSVAASPGTGDTLSVGPTNSTAGSAVVMVFKLAAVAGAAVPATGSVVFTSKGVSFGTGMLTTTGSGAGAVTSATVTTSSLPVGTDVVTGAYAGDQNYGAANPTAAEVVTSKAKGSPTTPALITLSSLAHTYNGAAQGATVATVPAGIIYEVTYNGSSSPPTDAGSYAVIATITDPSYTAPPATGKLTISKEQSKLSWTPYTTVSSPDVAIGTNVLNATCSVPGDVSYTALSADSDAMAVTSASFLTVGQYTLTSVCAPADSTDVASSSDSVAFTVINDSVFVANSGGEISAFFDNGTPQEPNSRGGGLGVAVDPFGNVWSINSSGSSVSKFDKTGAMLSVSSGGGLASAKALAVDDAGRVWVANGVGTISSLLTDGTAASTTAYASPALSNPNSISIDFKGSVWIANESNNTVTEVIGVAAPTVTPIISDQTQP